MIEFTRPFRYLLAWLILVALGGVVYHYVEGRHHHAHLATIVSAQEIKYEGADASYTYIQLTLALKSGIIIRTQKFWPWRWLDISKTPDPTIYCVYDDRDAHHTLVIEGPISRHTNLFLSALSITFFTGVLLINVWVT